MATAKWNCRACGTEVEVIVGQTVDRDRLLWHMGYNCPACGDQREEDGFDSAPVDVRIAILEQEGKWGLTLDGGQSREEILNALRLLRQALGLSIAETSELKRMLPGPLAVGTKIEIDRLLLLLSRSKIRAAKNLLDTHDVVKIC